MKTTGSDIREPPRIAVAPIIAQSHAARGYGHRRRCAEPAEHKSSGAATASLLADAAQRSSLQDVHLALRTTGGPLLRFIGKGRWPGNPTYCSGCFRALYRERDGAEVDTTLFFADIRGSTGLAETMPVRDFRALLDRFYAVATDVLVAHEAVVDKFVGDEVVGIFVPALTGPHHSRLAIDAALALLRATGNDGPAPWVSIGIGVNTGVAYVGVVGTAEHVEFTALGDAVNVTARLASAASAGELLVTAATVKAAGLPSYGGERRRLVLRGKSEPTDVFVLGTSDPSRIT